MHCINHRSAVFQDSIILKPLCDTTGNTMFVWTVFLVVFQWSPVMYCFVPQVGSLSWGLCGYWCWLTFRTSRSYFTEWNGPPCCSSLLCLCLWRYANAQQTPTYPSVLPSITSQWWQVIVYQDQFSWSQAHVVTPSNATKKCNAVQCNKKNNNNEIP